MTEGPTISELTRRLGDITTELAEQRRILITMTEKIGVIAVQDSQLKDLRDDIAELKAAVRTEIAEVKAAAAMYQQKAEAAAVRAEEKSDSAKRFVWQMAAALGSIELGILGFVWKLAGGS